MPHRAIATTLATLTLTACGNATTPQLTHNEEIRLAEARLQIATTDLANSINGTASTHAITESANHSEWLIRLVDRKACAPTPNGIVRDDARDMIKALEGAGLAPESNELRNALNDAPKCG